MHIARVVIDNLRALAHLDLSLADADGTPRPRVVLAGPNGCGKTTTLEAIAYAFWNGLPALREEAQPKLLDVSDLRTTTLPMEVALGGKQRGGGVAIEGVLAETTLSELQDYRSQHPLLFRDSDLAPRGWIKSIITKNEFLVEDKIEINLPFQSFSRFSGPAAYVAEMIFLSAHRSGLFTPHVRHFAPQMPSVFGTRQNHKRLLPSSPISPQTVVTATT